MANTSDIKNGLCIKHNGKLFQIIEFQHVKPGKGPAFVRTKMRQIESGKVLDHTFSAGHKIETVRIENRDYQYLYQDGDFYVFMNSKNYEQVNIALAMVEKSRISSRRYDGKYFIPRGGRASTCDRPSDAHHI